MKRIQIDHPAIKKMIFRRSGGDPSYIAGVRAFLREGVKPREGTIAYQGYLDAHDMTGYHSGILADLRADEDAEESRVFQSHAMEREIVHSAPQASIERPQIAQEIKAKQSRAVRL